LRAHGTAPGVRFAPDRGMATRQDYNIVLVHGGFVDGSGWEGVYSLLRADGYKVTVVQNSTLSLDGDVALTQLALAAQDRPVILVGHSYGGAVITAAGNEPIVAGLVYIAAFAPDAGESVETLIREPQGGAPAAPIMPPREGYLFLDRAKFHAAFAADLEPSKAAFMADAQVPWGVGAVTAKITQPAWKTKPSWYLVTTEDRMIPPDAQRIMARRAKARITETQGSHAIYVSRPDVVAALIKSAATSHALKAA
jgi:pimeloyl-ACP methyl ester carboxylesterase